MVYARRRYLGNEYTCIHTHRIMDMNEIYFSVMRCRAYVSRARAKIVLYKVQLLGGRTENYNINVRKRAFRKTQ